MNRNYRTFWAQATSAGTEKLRQNEHKGDMEVNIYFAYNRIQEEFRELREEIKTLRADDFRRIEDIHIGNLRSEFADILNFAGMGIIECDRLITERGYGTPIGEKHELRDDI